MKNNINDFLSSLNEQQKDAVQKIDGAVLILAGAGTGKTKALTSRIANLIEHNIAPWNILAVTFTNKAAKEMKERIYNIAGNASEGVWLGTFHSIGAKILRRHPEAVGLKSGFVIIDASDQLRIVKQIFKDHNIDEKRWDPKLQLYTINNWKDKGLTPDLVSAGDISDFAGGKSLELYKEYQQRLRNLNAADFGDLLLHNLTIFNKHPDILSDYHEKFKYILVDEYQDTNVCQYMWLRLLAQKYKNICCVGDDDQSIYGWRGAEVGNILRFEKDFTGASVIRLERNYRSTSNILSAASALIANNSDRLGKTLWTEGNDGNPIKLLFTWDDKEEARQVASEIESLQQVKKHPLNQMAVLVRAGFQTRAFEECFISNSIPYKVVGGLRFYDRAEIKDIISYLRIIFQHDDSLALERIINTPKRGIGNTTVQNIYAYSRDFGISMFESVKLMIEEKNLRPNVSKTLQSLISIIEECKRLSSSMGVRELTEKIANESGYITALKTENTLESQGRLDNIRELFHALQEFDSLEEFLDHISLVSDIESQDSQNMVSIMTLHGAKGLEFETVFLPGWEEGTFPSQRSIDESARKGLEEERRLAYVGITRAKKNLYILSASNRRIYGQYQNSIPSRFISELPEENIEKINLDNGYRFSSDNDFANYNKPKQNNTSPYKKINNNNKTSSQASPEGFKVGQKITHVKFGKGIVLNINADQLEIAFEGKGIKKIIDRYVNGV